MYTSYSEAATYLQEHLPFFQKSGASAYHPGLETTLKLLEFLGNPHLNKKYIHIGGTNGKGSCSHMMASVLQSAGYKTGLYTSPHMKRITERSRINGVEMDEKLFVDFVNRIRPAIEQFNPTFFEVTTVMALEYFSNCNVDIAVIEVGLGGRLDATNVIAPQICLITNIGHDHLDVLGPSLSNVATEKAGIIKSGIPVVIGERQEGLDEIFLNSANTLGCSIDFAQDGCQVKRVAGEFEIEIDKNHFRIKPDLAGYYQQKNICSVLVLLEIIKKRGWNIGIEAIRDGLSNAARQTGLRGRWQQIGDRPAIICDTAHNPEGIHEVIRQAADLRPERLHWVFGVVGDKDVEPVLKLLPREANYYFCRAQSPRAMDPKMLSAAAARHGIHGASYDSVNQALTAARNQALPQDLILVGGSTYVVAELDLS